PSWRLRGTSADGCWRGTVTFGWKRSATRWKPLPQAPKRQVMTQTMTQTPWLRALVLSKLLRDLVDLAGIEPATSSMPWKRAPSCATGPLLWEGRCPERGISTIFYHPHGLVKLPHCAGDVKLLV